MPAAIVWQHLNCGQVRCCTCRSRNVVNDREVVEYVISNTERFFSEKLNGLVTKANKGIVVVFVLWLAAVMAGIATVELDVPSEG